MNLSCTDRNKIISENVVQTTIYFEKRLQKIISLLSNDGFAQNQSVKQFFVSSYFYRIEFQQRGAPHVHSLLWLEDQNGDPAPTLWNNEEECQTSMDGDKTIEERIEKSNDELISCSVELATCPAHSIEESEGECEDCNVLQEYVRTFQTHSCTFTCRKKKKIMTISGEEGLGKNDKCPSIDLIIPVCRFKFPRFPIDKTTLLYPIGKDVNEKDALKMRTDLIKIKKYLARKTYYATSKEDEETWIKFKRLGFWQFLNDLGLFDDIPTSIDDTVRKELAKQRYCNALRMDIKGTGYVFSKREPKDVFINNYSKKLMPILQSNHDIQYVNDHFAAANYITSYLTKNEAGMSKLLKTVEEECKDLTKMEKLNKFAETLDKHREVSIQECIYRLLGLPMSKFSTKVKFLSTNHPNFRDGLLKGNLDDLPEDEPIFHFSAHQYYENRPLDNPEDTVYWEEMCLAEFWANYEVTQSRSRQPNSSIQPLLNRCGFIYQRKQLAVLRYYLNYDDPEDLARGLLILFYPFRNEMEDIHENDVLELCNNNKSLIEEKRKIFEKNINLVGLIEEIENIQQEKDDEDEDETDEEHNQHDIETTSRFNIDEFISSAKKAAQRNVARTGEDTGIPEIQTLRQRIMLLNTQQRRIFDDISEQFVSFNDDKKQICLYIAGEAGTGKSFLLKLIIDAVRYLKMSSGDEISKPKVIVMAPTANAAFIVGGKTIESALGINPKSQFNYIKPSDERQSNMKFVYEDVEVLFCDEISMVGASKLAKINYQLQSLSEGATKREFMGSRHFIATGKNLNRATLPKKSCLKDLKYFFFILPTLQVPKIIINSHPISCTPI